MFIIFQLLEITNCFLMEFTSIWSKRYDLFITCIPITLICRNILAVTDDINDMVFKITAYGNVTSDIKYT